MTENKQIKPLKRWVIKKNADLKTKFNIIKNK